MLWASGGDGAKIYWLPHSRVYKLARGFNSKMNDNSFEIRVLNMKRGFQRSQGNLRGWVRSTWMLHEISKSWFAIFPHENGLVSKHVRLSVWWECLVLLSVREMSDLRSELHWTAGWLTSCADSHPDLTCPGWRDFSVWTPQPFSSFLCLCNKSTEREGGLTFSN